jgi:microcin C transport system substrate-binding protein
MSWARAAVDVSSAHVVSGGVIGRAWGTKTAWWVALVLAAPSGVRADPAHGISLYGELRYPPDFKHFDYVEPNAPKGGAMRMPGLLNTFDNLNHLARKGTAASGMFLLDAFIYDRLTVRAMDEASSRYGLLAKSIELAPDRSWIEFVLRPEARWHDGQPVTADDVVFTFESIKAHASPLVKTPFLRVPKVEKRGPLTVRFTLGDPTDRQLMLVVADLIVMPRHYWQSRDIGKATLEPPLGSGPYKIAHVDPGRSIAYERVKDYWARDLPVNVGRFNFDRLAYEYFMDTDVRLEAIKGSIIDFTIESGSKTWARGYDFPARDRGHFKQEMIRTESPAVGRAIVFNTRVPKFKDVRVRKALAYAYDRDWTIRVLGNGFHRPANSYFEYSELAHHGPPSPAELALLEPFRAQLPAELFEHEFSMPRTSGVGSNRDNLRVAAGLLKEAGYVIDNGTLVDPKTGEPFTVEFLLDSPARVRFTLHYASALKKLGIETRMRVVDSSQLLQRRRTLDFELMYTDRLMGNTPNNELRIYFHSLTAQNPGTYNLAGIANPVVDRLIVAALSAKTQDDLVTACRALDRVLSFHYYGIDIGVVPGVALAFWNRFGHPPIVPRYLPSYPHAWWFDSKKDAMIRAGTPIPDETTSMAASRAN